MGENPGLRHWLRRRDQWTGADIEGWVPVGKSKFRDNPLAKMVTEETYAEIYGRCVVKGGALPVPINLKDMICVLITGWKMDNTWPPRPTVETVDFGPGPGRGGGTPRKKPAAAAAATPSNNGTAAAAAETAKGVGLGVSVSGKVRRYLGIK
jgi:hypothetical protein